MGFCSQIFSQSSLMPIAKIASAPTRPRRILWVIITTSMFIGLCTCIALVTLQYIKHQTVFQLDYSGRHIVYDQIPGITICPEPTEVLRLFKHASKLKGWPEATSGPPWEFPPITISLLNLLASGYNRAPGAIGHHLPVGILKWDTEKLAKSPIYRLLHNFSVQFRIKPANLEPNYQLFVLEQVPHKRNFICTTFELTSRQPNSAWSYLEINVSQDIATAAIATDTVGSIAPLGATFAVIAHERGELPFSAYDRNIYTMLSPSTHVSIYYSKSVTRRINTARNPCHEGADAEWLSRTAEGLGLYANVSYSSEHFSSAEMDKRTNFDYLDSQRLKIQQIPQSSGMQYLPYKSSGDDLRKTLSRKSRKSVFSFSHQQDETSDITVALFNTPLLYSREACGWSVCCEKVAVICNCTCSMDWLLSTGAESCPNIACETKQCSDTPIPYERCPMPCVITKLIKQNSLVVHSPESGLQENESYMKLIRSENVQVATEEEIYSLAKLFSEIGGLCSLFIGFSCIFFFELLEAVLLLKQNKTPVNGTKVADKSRPKHPVYQQTNDDLYYRCKDEQTKKILYEQYLQNSCINSRNDQTKNCLNNRKISFKEKKSFDESNGESRNLIASYYSPPIGSNFGKDFPKFITLPVVLRNGSNVSAEKVCKLDFVDKEQKEASNKLYLSGDSCGFSKMEILALLRSGRLRFKLVFTE